MDVLIVPMLPHHWLAVAKVYRQGMATGNATFEKTVPEFETWDQGHLPACRIVALAGEELAGWAALTAVSGRCVYAGVAEVSIYIGEAFREKKVGSALMQQLISESEKEGVWTLQAGIFPENQASIRLHEKHGFRQVGYRSRIGKMDGIWRDTVLLERRSTVVGVD